MRNFMLGIFLGSVIGGVVGTMASDEICQMKKKAIKTGKKILKKYDLM